MNNGKEYALKCIEIKNSRSAFLEARILERVSDHPNIAKLHQVICNKTEIYLVLELVKGCTFMDLMLTHKVIPESCAKKWMIQLTDAMSYIHSKSIIHRDIKAGNVMIDIYGNAKLIDFGVGEENHANWSNMVAGTVTCMSPEMLRDGHYNGYNNDVWSLGVLLFTMVSGFHPFDKDVGGHYRARFNGNNYKTWLMSELVTSTINNNYQVPAGVSWECRDLIEKCMTSIGSPRIKSNVILTHLWFKKCSNDSNISPNGYVIKMPFSPLYKFK
ncbi:putative protein serine/threonine kinase [Tieghemostelium lacteum]|uniref:Protein kinase domain-containing protein n=1 Tax=Tieghemostelium lacteum TaxID=361077 RepID=A0A152A3X0_TIELA|nr:putative protein serine/threonine kinase [Tieghemostelium lacteum]|eukprot:KYR00751.1 putative protein serine/threonine kinase [Tieghemostelium lacteum]